MNITLAKRIDFFAGIPICALLSLCNMICRPLSSRRVCNDKPKKVLFLGFSEIGSAILASQAIEKARKRFPGADIFFWSFGETAQIVRLIGLVPDDNIITMRSSSIPALFTDCLKNIRRIRNEQIDTVVDMELFSRFSSILSYVTGAVRIAGFYRYKSEGLYRGNLHTHKVTYNPYLHMSENFIALVDSLDVAKNERPLLKSHVQTERTRLPKITRTTEEIGRMWQRLKKANSPIKDKMRTVIVNYGFDDKLIVRRWPVEYYTELIRRLLAQEDVLVLLIGSGKRPACSIPISHERCLDLIGKTTMAELLTLCSMSQVLISHDSGLVHIASLTDIPIVALFGPETPLLYGPLTQTKKVFYKKFACSPCLSAYNHRSTVCRDNMCLKAITVDEIYDEICTHI
ncbi:MAG: glycosyltransferase family 9 protein [Candidatus Omnitrophica bacterium]|nr:glycosyltransferase family 9 protein [Candidatus Omnitrophota bacterium]